MKPVLLRVAEPGDWPAIEQMHRAHQASQGTNYELPWLFGPSIAVALVGVDAAGSIRNCVYVELVGEMRFVGCDAAATAFARREIRGLDYVLELRGLRWLECFVPRTVNYPTQASLEWGTVMTHAE